MALHVGKSTGLGGLKFKTGLLSKKFEERSSNPPFKVGITRNSSWEGLWWKPIVCHNSMSLSSISLLLQDEPNQPVWFSSLLPALLQEKIECDKTSMFFFFPENYQLLLEQDNIVHFPLKFIIDNAMN